jgi:hypothetical protein
MDSLICRYCGKTVMPRGGLIFGNNGTVCPASPNKNHVLISNPPRCVYCGAKTRVLGNVLHTDYGFDCKHSPTKKHILQ